MSDVARTSACLMRDLAERVNRIANVLTRDLGVVPGNRVLLRGPNSPMMVAAYFAVIKAGAVVVATMPLLRAKEIAFPLTKAEIRPGAVRRPAGRRNGEGAAARARCSSASSIGAPAADDSLEAMMRKDGYERFAACDTASDDVCLIAFTSGTTGVPKGTMHFHRDMLAICDTFGKYVLRAERERSLHRLAADRLYVRSRRSRAVSAARRRHRRSCLERASPDDLLPAIANLRATICFTAPTAFRGDARQACRFRSVVAAQMRFGRRDLAGGDLRGLGGGDRHPHHRRAWFHGNAAHLRRQPRGGHAPGRDRQAGSRLRGAGDR